MLESLALSALATSAVLSIVLGAWLALDARTERLRQRVAALAPSRDRGLAALRARYGAFEQDPNRFVIRRWLWPLVEASGLPLSPGVAVAIAILLPAFSGAIAWLLSGELWAGLAMAAAMELGFLGFLVLARRRRRDRFVAQLADTVVMLATAIRAGRTVTQAVQLVAAESPQPTRDFLDHCVRETIVGGSIGAALARLGGRIRSGDLDLFVASVALHERTGTPLANLLDDIAAVVRDRERLNDEVRAVTAQQRYSALVLAALPPFAAAVLFTVSPDYAGALLAPGPLRAATIAAAVMVGLGFLWLQRLGSVDA